MTTYRAYGRTIESDRALPELQESAGPPELQISWTSPVSVPEGARWSTLWQFSAGEPWLTAARTDDARYFRFNRFAEFRVTADRIDVGRRGFVRESTLRHLLLDQVLPLALAARGNIVLHASAVRHGHGAVLLAGQAGSGKSTLAALLAADGWSVLADDGVLVSERDEGLVAVPSYPGLRLCADVVSLTGMEGLEPVAEYTRKQRVIHETGGTRFGSEAAPLTRIYLLRQQGTGIAIDRVSRRDAALELLEHVYRADVHDREDALRQLDLITRWTGSVEVWRLTFPAGLGSAAAVAGALTRHVGAGER